MLPLRRSQTARGSPGEIRKKSILKKSESVRGVARKSNAAAAAARANDSEAENLLPSDGEGGAGASPSTAVRAQRRPPLPQSVLRHTMGASSAGNAITYGGGILGAGARKAGDPSFYYRREDAGYAADGLERSGDEPVREKGGEATAAVRRGQEAPSDSAADSSETLSPFSKSMPNVRTVKSSSSTPSVTVGGRTPPASTSTAASTGVGGGGMAAAVSTSSSVFSPCSATPPSLLASSERIAYDRGAHAAAIAAAVAASAASSRDIQTSTTTLAAAAVAAAASRRKFERGRDPSHSVSPPANRDNSAAAGTSRSARTESGM